ncbi:hypothetical protein TWF481_008803 [Arthrobotrys musiformis]|uniref:SCP domain-containing protein n=1 Tax=Arthrobotrys musiformis TaxID=47236 RepID=A0AAV9WA81_9PEZI
MFRGIILFLFTLLGLATGVFGLDAVKGSQGTDVGVQGDELPSIHWDALGNLQVTIALVNKYRTAHQVSELTWNTTLAQYAANAAYPCKFGHSNGPYGETLAGSNTINNPEWYIWYLYDENKDYDFKNPKVPNPATAHFTQLVWASTKQMGCAFIEGCKDVKYQLWCEFVPKGSTGSQLAYRNNVKPADKTKEIPGMPPAHI